MDGLPESLRARFEQFVRGLNGFENIDDLLKSCDPQGKKRADYLFQARTVIVEQKTLEIDPSARPQRFLEKILQERGIGFWGTRSFRDIFSRIPDGEELRRRMILDLAKNIDDIISLSDKQTRDTREIFSVPNAAGIVVILNQGASLLDVDIITYALSQVFQKKGSDSYRYQHSDAVLLISDIHPLPFPGYERALPIVPCIAPLRRNYEIANAFMQGLISEWAQFNGVPLIRAPMS